MSNRVTLAREAMRGALQLRRSLSIAREDAVNVYDIADALGIDTRFVDVPSLEGMFLREPHPVVLLPSSAHRPRGRIAYSCAHEIGHFQLGHGTRVDEYVGGDTESRVKSDEELAADVFAASLLMPRQAVMARLQVRGWDPATMTPLQVYAVAGELGVGYDTLIRHMRYGLEIVDDAWAKRYRRVAPKDIRAEVLGEAEASALIVADEFWPGVPIDMEIGDVCAVPRDANARDEYLRDIGVRENRRLLAAERVGLSVLLIGQARCQVRIARRAYCGQLKYRFLPEPEMP